MDIENLLITGGCGFIGSNFIRYMLANDKFHGRIVNVDLRERREIIHITLDKSPVLHALVAGKIVAILRPRAPPKPAPVSYTHLTLPTTPYV